MLPSDEEPTGDGAGNGAARAHLRDAIAGAGRLETGAFGAVVSEDPGEGPSPVMDDFSGKRALLAEDMEVNREIVIALLEPTNLAIDCAVNGTQAVSMFTASPSRYDIIFMDLQMPEMDGFEATRLIRSLSFPEAARVPIIAMTANVFREDVEKTVEVGMNSHLGKPLDLEQLLATLRTYLSETPTQAAQDTLETGQAGTI
jgi:CheY-like chemotaxis protein